ncbi:MAG TPA: flagellar hook-basal body complex protein FliE [Spirochaetia bacterium]|nr:flagellar hook-basal body complex protein FliE [Spirochaetia bacterium]
MTYLNATQVTGHELTLARTDPRHYAGRLDPQPSGNQDGTFGSMLMNSLNSVNAQQQTADNLAVQAVVDPENVNTHDVTIAAAKANLSLSITKSVVDRVIQAYREIQNVR